MKIKINIECTPEEARTFLGLPDISPVNTMVMDEMQRRMQDGFKAMDPEALVKGWLPTAFQGWEAMQQLMQAQMRAAASKPGRKEE